MEKGCFLWFVFSWGLYSNICGTQLIIYHWIYLLSYYSRLKSAGNGIIKQLETI